MSFEPVTSKLKKRVVVASLFLFVLFSLLIVQFYKIQILEGDRWAKEAKLQHERIISEPFRRGVFFSNTSIKKGHPAALQPFVVDIQKFHLHIDPFLIPEALRQEIAARLIVLIKVPDACRDSFRAEFYKKSRSRRVAKWLDVETKKKILEWWEIYATQEKIVRNAIFFCTDYQRSYPFGNLLGQVLHTIRDNKDEITKEGLPTGGLELQFNEILKGRQGKRLLVHSPRHPFEMGRVLESPQNGANIYLTINHYLQAIAEEEIAKGVQKVKAQSGWAVMMDPFTGEILALAQYPSFDPSDYRTYFNDPALINQTKVKAITDANEIGSTMKAISVAVALKANLERAKLGKPPLFSPQEKIATSDGSFPGRKALKDTSLHYYLNMWMGLQKSSNIYVARLIDRVVKAFGNEWYRNILEQTFGFGMKTGIELPGEVAGLLPRPGKKHPNGKLEWSLPTPYSLAMGHNIQATSLQLLRASAIFANGGFLVSPTMIRKIVKEAPDGSEEVLLDQTSIDRVKAFPRVLEAEIVEQIVNALKYTTKAGGSAVKANIFGFTEAGKTGTTEKIVGGSYSKKHNISSFIGFSPVKNPRFILLVTIDEPEAIFIPGVGKMSRGGQCAAPVFREIGKRALEYLGETPDDPFGYPEGDPRYNPEKADWIPETLQLQALYREWNHKEGKE